MRSLFFFILISFISCSNVVSRNDEVQQNKVTIARFDIDFYNYLQEPTKQKEDSLLMKYPGLLPAFALITDSQIHSRIFDAALLEYFSHPALMSIYRDALNTFKDVTVYEEQLTQADQLIRENFPDKRLPQLAMHVSGFKENVIVLNNLISISTDKYLGVDYPAYQNYFQAYQQQQMQPQFLVRDYIKAWLISDLLIVDNEKQQNLLSAMIDDGKILYALSLLLPDYSANDLIGYTAKQMDWCKQNEKNIWQTIVKKSNLFSTDHMLITRYINDAPYTAPISTQSPGRIGCWIGWQIVNQYAKKSEASLEDILKLDAQAILKASKYNP